MVLLRVCTKQQRLSKGWEFLGWLGKTEKNSKEYLLARQKTKEENKK
jgi:hypothetical protein